MEDQHEKEMEWWVEEDDIFEIDSQKLADDFVIQVRAHPLFPECVEALFGMDLTDLTRSLYDVPRHTVTPSLRQVTMVGGDSHLLDYRIMKLLETLDSLHDFGSPKTPELNEYIAFIVLHSVSLKRGHQSTSNL